MTASLLALKSVLMMGVFLPLGPYETGKVKSLNRPLTCLDVKSIKDYKTVSDTLVILDTLKGRVSMKLTKGCQNLHFHRYISYIPLNGQLCVNRSEVRSRSGYSCTVSRLKPVVEDKKDLTLTGGEND